MKYLILFSMLILFGCMKKPEKKTNDQEVIELKEHWICIDEKKEAVKLLKENTIQFVLINDFPRYEEQLNELLLNYKLQLKKIGSMHGEGYCLRKIMDSVINVRFGKSFKEEIKDKADSLFLNANRGAFFTEEQLDQRPILGSNPDTNGQDEIITRLNKKISTQDSIRLISNIVNAPYVVVRFSVGRNGISRSAKIIERNSTESYKALEKLIINEINGLKGWSPGQIRNENVDSTVDIAIAVSKNE